MGCNSLRRSVLVPRILAEHLVLAPLAKATDAILLAGQIIPELVGGLAAHHALRPSHSQHTAATKQVEGETILEGIHSIHRADSIPYATWVVNRYFEKK